MPDKMDEMLKSYYRFEHIRPPTLTQKEQMLALIRDREQTRRVLWNAAAALLFFGMVWALNTGAARSLARRETWMITGEKEQVRRDASQRWQP